MVNGKQGIGETFNLKPSTVIFLISNSAASSQKMGFQAWRGEFIFGVS